MSAGPQKETAPDGVEAVDDAPPFGRQKENVPNFYHLGGFIVYAALGKINPLRCKR